MCEIPNSCSSGNRTLRNLSFNWALKERRWYVVANLEIGKVLTNEKTLVAEVFLRSKSCRI